MYLRRQAGLSLIEVLVTLVILMIGLLGLAGIIVRSNQAEMESYQRVQALQILQDISERMSANRAVADCYSNGATGLTLGINSAPPPVCADANATAHQKKIANSDLTELDNLIKGSSTKIGTNKVGAMIGAVACIKKETTAAAAPAADPAAEPATESGTESGAAAVNPKDTYLIAVSWQGLASTSAPKLANGEAFPCGNGLYGDETLHRVITTKIRLGDF
ncbi:MAG: type IV pilus modification protein PilV [Brachymonas sp.]|nr:type IV pilus modification protein PilV [Brachymonas sp.]